MTPEKILEIARRFDPDEPDFVMTEDTLIAFAQSVIEAVQEETTIKVPASVFVKIVKDVNTVKDLLIAMKAAEEEPE
jgi:hypothetical protein